MKKRRVLLVDDDAGITRALAMYLDADGDCEVRVENAGRRALAAAREFRPDVIFLDIVMPDADGGTIAADIKSDPVLKNTPVVFLTALVSQHKTHGAQAQSGGHPFLAKPVDPDVVLACIVKCVPVQDAG
jgi:two-component system OmpR family response regulator